MTPAMWVTLAALLLALLVIGGFVGYFVVRFLLERRSNARIAARSAWQKRGAR